jgi:hypothetical protein
VKVEDIRELPSDKIIQDEEEKEYILKISDLSQV